jgi:hypothetical protein
LQDRLGNEILRGDEFDAGGLAAKLVAKDFSDFRIHVVKTAAHSYQVGSFVFHLVAPCRDLRLNMLRGFVLYARLPQLSIIQRVYKFVKILSERCVLCNQTQHALCR